MAGHDKAHRLPSNYALRQICEARVHHDFTLSSAATGSLRLAMVSAAGLSAKVTPHACRQTLRNNEVDDEARSNHSGQTVHVRQFLLVTSAYLVMSHHLPRTRNNTMSSAFGGASLLCIVYITEMMLQEVVHLYHKY